MSVERVWFAGGALHGKVVWIEHDRTTLDVHLGGQVPGAGKTLHYRKTGTLLCYVGESPGAVAGQGTTRPPDAPRSAASIKGAR